MAPAESSSMSRPFSTHPAPLSRNFTRNPEMKGLPGVFFPVSKNPILFFNRIRSE